MEQGTIILIGGLSSSGKTSVARELQSLLAERDQCPFVHMPIDLLMSMLPEQWFSMNAHAKIERHPSGITFIDQRDEQGPKTKIQVGEVAMRLLSVYFLTLKLLASKGNNIISDAVFNSDFLRVAAHELADFRVYSIGIVCPLEITQEREKKRGAADGGYIGLSRWYFEETDTHKHDYYDLSVDSSCNTPQEVAQMIYDFIVREEPAALKRLEKGF
jgi:chloramphenicol 3-O phosphotransferase